MSNILVTALHTEERSIIAELRASKQFQRLESIHKLLALYDAKPSVAVSLDAVAEPDRNAAPVIQLAPPSLAAPIAMPAPVGEPSVVEPLRVAQPAAPAAAPAAVAQDEAGGVVSSVRAALLGIGKA